METELQKEMKNVIAGLMGKLHVIWIVVVLVHPKTAILEEEDASTQTVLRGL